MSDNKWKEIDERFDKVFGYLYQGGRIYPEYSSPEVTIQVKAFIHSEIERAEKEALKKFAVKIHNNNYCTLLYHTVSVALAEMEEKSQ